MQHLPTQPAKGTRDFLPEEMSIRTQLFAKLFHTVELFGFQRYDGPILESAAIYEAKSGAEIANQQMYRLIDKSGRELALRPEMTPSIARIVAGNQHKIKFPARWYSHVNCHRYERPQRGRVREHWQLNVDIFGSEAAAAEIEIFDLIGALMSALGADKSMYVIRVNDRVLIEGALSNYVGISKEKLGAVSMVIDRWEKVDPAERSSTMKEIGLVADQIKRLEELVTMDLPAYLHAAGPVAAEKSKIARIINDSMSASPLQFDPIIVRGFDYYTATVFEVFDVLPTNRRSLFGGGRYDNLAGLFTDRKIPGIGFGMGDVTTWNFLEQRNLLPKPDINPVVFVFATSEEYNEFFWQAVRQLRNADIKTSCAFDYPGIKNGLKYANAIAARFTVIIGENEFHTKTVTIKNMSTQQQTTVPLNQIVATITA